MQIKLTDASASQLADYSTLVLGLDGIDFRLGAEKIIARMRNAGFDRDAIEIDEVRDSDSKPTGIKAPVAGQAINKQRTIKVLIQTSEEPGGSDPIPLGVNGRYLLAPRGKEIDLKPEFVEVLDHAKRQIYEPIQPDLARGIMGGLGKPREAHQFPFSILSAA